jgi:hypothetical protein
MPTYRNSTVADIAVGAFRFPANSDMETDTYLETVPTGLALISALPVQSQSTTLLANKYTALTGADIATIAVPASPSKAYIVSFYVESGEFQIRFNDASMTPPIRVTEGERWTRKYVSRVVNDIRIHCVVGGNIYVSVDIE